MICRIHEKKVELVPEDYQMESKYPIELNYYLIESEVSQAESPAEKVYGIEIVKTVNQVEVERQEYADISYCRKITRDLLNKLIDNVVTPVSLAFVLDDWMAE